MPDASSIQSIPSISLSRGGSSAVEQGKFDNAFIKALNIDIGITDNPTSINVGLVNALGQYNDQNLSYLDAYNLQLGNSLNIWCYLISQKKSTSTDNKTTELEFVDGSHILDRIFIGGVGVHTLRQEFWRDTVAETEIPVTCPPCYANNIIQIPDPNATDLVIATSQIPTPSNKVYVPPIFTQRNLKTSNLNGIGDNSRGGYIFLGDEKFTETSCDLADVDYSFDQLVTACAKMQIDIKINDKSKTPSGVSTLRRSYWGTLREVLKSWCADFGVSFVYDYSLLKPTVREVDLSRPTLSNEIDQIANLAKLIKAGDTSLVQQITEDKTIKGSYKNNLVTTYRRERTLRSYDKNTFYGTAYKCFQTEDVLTLEARSYRGVGAFNLSCSLAKYDESIRALYLTFLAGLRYNSGFGDGLIYRALGFEAVLPVGVNLPLLKREILDECLSTDTYNDVVDNFTANNIFDYDMIIGAYSEDVAKKHADFEKSFAEDFMGKYWYTNLDSFADQKYGGFQLCYTGQDWRYEIESSMSPEPMDVPTSTSGLNSSNLSARLFNQAKLPFSKNLWGPIPINPWKFYDWFSDPRIKIFNRSEAPWSATQEQFEQIFKQNTSEGVKDLALPFLPRFQKIEGVLETRLRARFRNTAFDVGSFIDNLKNQASAVLMIAPKPARLGQILQISPYFVFDNPNETPYYLNKGKGMGNKVDCQGSLKCEIQQAMDKEICKPENHCSDYPQPEPATVTPENSVGKIYGAQDGEPFAEGVQSFQGGAFSILFAPPIIKGAVNGPPRGGGPQTIVAPAGTFSNVNDLYLANYKEHVKSDNYTPKVETFIGDEKLTTPGNVSEVKIKLNNVSSNEPFFAGIGSDGKPNIITKVYVTGIGFLTLEQYHEFIKELEVQSNENNNIKHDVSVSFGNLDFGTLAPFLNAKFGLNKLSCSIDAQGINASASWSNRPATLPSSELFTQEIVPQIISRKNLL